VEGLQPVAVIDAVVMGGFREDKGEAAHEQISYRFNGTLQYYVILWEGKIGRKKLNESVL
jgi:hypothetical protein